MERGEHRFPRSSRLHLGSEIRAVMGRGKRRRTDHLDVFFAASPVSRCRWGLVVPKHRHTLVQRNLLKRRLREIGRIEVLPALRRGGCELDVLVRARKEAYDAPFRVLMDEVLNVVRSICPESSSSR